MQNLNSAQALSGPVGEVDLAAPSDRGRRFFNLVKIAVGFALLAVLFHYDVLSLDEMAAIAFEPAAVAFAIILITASLLAGTIRWSLLLRCQRIDLSLRQVFQIVYIGQFFSTVLPGSMGGDAFRLVYGIRLSKGRNMAAALSILADRICGLWGLLGLGAVALLIWMPGSAERPQLTMALGVSLVLMAALLGAFPFLLVVLDPVHRLTQRVGLPCWPAVEKLLSSAHRTLATYRGRSGLLVMCCGLSILVHGFAVGGVIVVANSLAIGSLAPGDYAFVSPLAMLVNMVPLSPGGLGIGEGAFDQLCRWIEPVHSGAPYGTVFLTFRAMSAIAVLPGLFFFLSGPRSHTETEGKEVSNS